MTSEEKNKIARWIVEQCTEPCAEIEWLLDKAYPESSGTINFFNKEVSARRFHNDFDDVLKWLDNDKGVKNEK